MKGKEWKVLVWLIFNLFYAFGVGENESEFVQRKCARKYEEILKKTSNFQPLTCKVSSQYKKLYFCQKKKKKFSSIHFSQFFPYVGWFSCRRIGEISNFHQNAKNYWINQCNFPSFDRNHESLSYIVVRRKNFVCQDWGKRYA